MLIVPLETMMEKTIEIRYVVPDGRPGAAALVPLTTISRKAFNDFGQDTPVESAFERAVTAVFDGTKLPQANTPLQKLANESVTAHTNELLEIIHR